MTGSDSDDAGRVSRDDLTFLKQGAGYELAQLQLALQHTIAHHVGGIREPSTPGGSAGGTAPAPAGPYFRGAVALPIFPFQGTTPPALLCAGAPPPLNSDCGSAFQTAPSIPSGGGMLQQPLRVPVAGATPLASRFPLQPVGGIMDVYAGLSGFRYPG